VKEFNNEQMAESSNHDRSTVVNALDEPSARLKRRSYTREKIEVLDWYFSNGRNKYQACKRFAINSKTLAEWLRDEAKIRASNRGTRKMGAGRKPFWPDMEAELVRQFQELRTKGLKVRSWWFEAKGKELMTSMHADVEFRFSPGWFDAFKKRHKLSYRATTNTSQRPPSHLESAVRDFHRAVRSTALRGPTGNMGPLGQYELRDIANMDQTPLPFVLNGGKGHEKQGAKTVWHRAEAVHQAWINTSALHS
jgi:hypothetical protein